MAAGALLFDARQSFEQQKASADEALRSIVGQLAEAVTSCVDAAGAELDPVRQAALLKVGSTSQKKRSHLQDQAAIQHISFERQLWSNWLQASQRHYSQQAFVEEQEWACMYLPHAR